MKNRYFWFRSAPLLLMVILLIAGTIIAQGCSPEGNDNNGESSDVTIEWVARMGADEPIIKYVYTGGSMTAMQFFFNFSVASGSGDVQINATIKEAHGDHEDMLDEHTESFDVVEGVVYEIVVDVDIIRRGSCAPLDNDAIVLKSPSASSENEIVISPLLDVNDNTWQCVGEYSISGMQLQ